MLVGLWIRFTIAESPEFQKIKDNGAVGRIPYLVPVTWKDGWPVLGEDGKVVSKQGNVGPGFSITLKDANGKGVTAKTGEAVGVNQSTRT